MVAVRSDSLRDLAGHLAYHAHIGFAECRGLDAPTSPVPAVEFSGRTEDNDVEFEVEHRGERFLITVERVMRAGEDLDVQD